MRLAHVLLLTALATQTSKLSAAVIFEDNFNNGVVNNSDTINAFWSSTNVAGTTATEAGSTLTLAIGTTAATGNVSRQIQSVIARPEFDFFDYTDGLTYGVEGLVFGGNNGQKQRFIMNLTTGAVNTDSVQVNVRNVLNTIDLNIRADGTVASATFDLDDTLTLTGFELSLNSTGYSLLVKHTGGLTPSTSFTGSISPLTAANWAPASGNPNADTQVIFQTLATSHTATETGSATIDRFFVATVPEPATLTLLTLATVSVFSGRRRPASIAA